MSRVVVLFRESDAPRVRVARAMQNPLDIRSGNFLQAPADGLQSEHFGVDAGATRPHIEGQRLVGSPWQVTVRDQNPDQVVRPRDRGHIATLWPTSPTWLLRRRANTLPLALAGLIGCRLWGNRTRWPLEHTTRRHAKAYTLARAEESRKREIGARAH